MVCAVVWLWFFVKICRMNCLNSFKLSSNKNRCLMLCGFVWQKMKTFYQMKPMQLLHCKSQSLKVSAQTVQQNMQNVRRKILDNSRKALNAKIKMTNKILLLNRLMKRNCWNYKSWAYHLPFVLMYAVPGRKSKQHKELPGQSLMIHSRISMTI